MLETPSHGPLRVDNVVVEPCVYGLPRCPHCNGITEAACDATAVIKECQNEDVSQHSIYALWMLTVTHV